MIYCRLTPNEKLADRFLFSGLLGDENLSLAYLIEITKPWFPTSRVAPVIINELKSGLASLDKNENLLAGFENVLKNVNEALFDLSEQGETEWIGNLNSLIVLISGHGVHLAQTGSLPGYLFRKQKINQVTEGLALEREAHPLKTFSSIISGELEADDRILLANHELFNVLSLDMLRQIILGNSPYFASLSILRYLRKHNVPTVSTIILDFSPKTSPNTEPETVIIEEGFERWHKKLWRFLKPKIITTGQAVKSTSIKARETYKSKISPTLSSAAQKGLFQAKKTSQIASQYTKDKIVPAVREGITKVTFKKAEVKNPLPLESLEPEKPIQVQQPIADKAPIIKGNKLVVNRPRKPLKLLVNKRLIVAVLVLILLSSSFILMRARQKRNQEAASPTEIENSLKTIDSQITEAEAAKSSGDKDSSLTKALVAYESLNNLPKEAIGEEVKATQAKLDRLLDDLNQVTRLASALPMITFSDETVDRLSMITPYFFTTSSKNGKIFRQASGNLDTAKEQEIKLSQPVERGVTDLFLQESGAEVNLVLVSGNGEVWALSQTDNKTSSQELLNPLGKYATANAAQGYLGNLYLLDGSTGLLWKYPKIDQGFGKGVNQIDVNTVDVKKGLSLAIDGSIYVLKEDSSVIKLLKGQPEDFTLQAPPKPLDQISKPLKILTDSKEQHLYILDGGVSNSQPGRILEYDKSGNYIKQFFLPSELNNIKDIAMNLAERKTWILSGTDVYEFTLP